MRCGHIVPIPKIYMVKNGLSVLFVKKYGFSVFNTKYLFSEFNTNYGSIRTKYGDFSLKYGIPYIWLSYLYFFKKNFRFSVFLGQLLRRGHIVPTPKINRVKNGPTVLFAKKMRKSVYRLKPFIKILWSVFFAFRAVLFYLYFFKQFLFLFSVFLRQSMRCEHIVPIPKLKRVKNGLFVLFAKKIRVFRVQY